MKTKRDFSAAATLLLAATLSTTALAHEPDVSPFTMAVIQNDASGTKVRSGKYQQAIDRITRRGSRSPKRFAEQVNLCVAYVKTRVIDKAMTACDAAITRAEEQASRLANSERSAEARASRTDLALALSNRGVLLAATGKHEIAKQDFQKAIDLESTLSYLAENNLERLGSESSS